MVLSVLAPCRDLRLVQLHGHGLRRLGLARGELIDCGARHYPRTRSWAEALYRSDSGLDGLAWVSRQHDRSLALVLFGGRVERSELEVVEAPMPLAWGPGFDQVQKAADAAGIVVLVE